MGISPEEFNKLGLVKDPKTGNFKKPEKKKIAKPKKTDYKGHIWIPGQVPSLKNSKQIFFKKTKSPMKGSVKCYMNGSPAVPFITSSKQVKKYQNETAQYYQKYASVFRSLIQDLEPPYYVCFFFSIKRKSSFDFNNANHMVTDMMVKNGWLEDDNMDLLLPIPPLNGQAYQVSPKNPGVWITVKKFKTT